MTTLSPVTAASAANTTHDQQQQRVPVNYGAAWSHREMVREKLRVDPASVAEKKRSAPEARGSDTRREYDTEDREAPGQYVDIET